MPRDWDRFTGVPTAGSRQRGCAEPPGSRCATPRQSAWRASSACSRPIELAPDPALALSPTHNGSPRHVLVAIRDWSGAGAHLPGLRAALRRLAADHPILAMPMQDPADREASELIVDGIDGADGDAAGRRSRGAAGGHRWVRAGHRHAASRTDPGRRRARSRPGHLLRPEGGCLRRAGRATGCRPRGRTHQSGGAP